MKPRRHIGPTNSRPFPALTAIQQTLVQERESERDDQQLVYLKKATDAVNDLKNGRHKKGHPKNVRTKLLSFPSSFLPPATHCSDGIALLHSLISYTTSALAIVQSDYTATFGSVWGGSAS